MTGRLNELGSMRVCIDEYNNGELQGRLYAACNTEAVEFGNLMMLIKSLQKIFDESSYPQATVTQRSFSKKEAETVQHDRKGVVKPQQRPTAVWTAVCGKKATFCINVLFRQNASWQGNIAWLEKGLEESFRSTLELVMLMDSAFDESELLAAGEADQDSLSDAL